MMALNIHAQSAKTIGEAYAETVYKFSASQLDSLEKYLVSKYKNDPKVMTEIAGAYIGNQDFNYAHRLIKKTIEKNPKSPEPYIKYGWMYDRFFNQFENGLDSALYYYDKAIALNPKDERAYIGKKDVLMSKKYKMYKNADDTTGMKHVADSAILVLKALKRERPNYLVERDMGSIYMEMDNTKDAYDVYSHIEDSLYKEQFYNYAYSAWSIKKFDEAIALADKGYAKFPDYPDFLRIKMYAYYAQSKAPEAIDTYKQLCEKKDTMWMSRDHYYAGHAYLMNKDIVNATLTFNKIYDISDYDENKYPAINESARLIRKEVDGLKAEGEYVKAAEMYSAYANYKKNRQGYDYYSLADIWREMAADITIPAEEREMAVWKADNVYATLQKDFPNYEISSIIYFRGINLWVGIDQGEEMVRALARPHFENLIDYESSHPGETNRDYIANAYKYMAIYNLYITKDNKKAVYFTKMMKEVNPSDSSLDSILALDNSRKTKKRR